MPAPELDEPPPAQPPEPDPGKKPPPVTPTPSPEKPAPPIPNRVELGKAVFVPPCILVQRSGNKGPWQRVPLNRLISSTDYVVSLPGYRSELRLESGVHLQLWGNLPEFSQIPLLESAVLLHAPPNGFDVDFTLDHGRVILSSHKPKGPARARIRFRDEVWDLTLTGSDSAVAVDLLGFCAPYSREQAGEPETAVRLYNLAGDGELTIGYRKLALKGPCTFDWNNVTGRGGDPERIPRPPDWWTRKQLPDTPPAKTMHRALGALAQRLISVANKELDVVLAEVLKDTDVASQFLALRCLGAMEDIPSLLDVLGNDKSNQLRIEAVRELRHLLGANPANERKLFQAFVQKNYSKTQAENALQLLHGFTKELWQDPQLRSKVVELLLDDKVGIRQLTFSWLLNVTPAGMGIPYDPAGDRDQLERGYKEWRRLVIEK
jgi:hypothetical protein